MLEQVRSADLLLTLPVITNTLTRYSHIGEAVCVCVCEEVGDSSVNAGVCTYRAPFKMIITLVSHNAKCVFCGYKKQHLIGFKLQLKFNTSSLTCESFPTSPKVSCSRRARGFVFLSTKHRTG